MERDARRDRGQWRGCHSFKGIVCDGDRPGTSSRNGGLKMGQPYYFYVSRVAGEAGLAPLLANHPSPFPFYVVSTDTNHIV